MSSVVGLVYNVTVARLYCIESQKNSVITLPLCYPRSLDPVAERLVNWVPYLLNHLNSFINKFHSNVVNLGPRVFMSCPLHSSSAELESWFHSLWNHFIIPYLMGTIMAGIEVGLREVFVV